MTTERTGLRLVGTVVVTETPNTTAYHGVLNASAILDCAVDDGTPLYALVKGVVADKPNTKGSRKALGAMNAKLKAKVGRLERELAALKAQAPAADALFKAARRADDVLSALIRNNQPLETLAREYGGDDWHIEVGKIRTELVVQLAAAPAVSVERLVVPQCFAELLHHAHGMTMGADWNKGTMAGYHRKPLGEAVAQCQVWLASAPAPSTTEDQGDE